MGRLAQADDRRLGGRVGREPRLSELAGDRRRVHHQRLAVLGARLLEHGNRLAQRQVHGAQVDVELHVELLRLVVRDVAADADAGIVDEDVHAAEPIAVMGHKANHVLLLRHVGRHGLHLESLVAEARHRLLELLGPPRRDGERVAVLPQRSRDRESDPT